MSNTSNTLVVFLDSIGRTVIGTKANETEDILSVKNPALVAVNPNVQTGQIQLQILPLFFKEFLADKDQPTVWNYKKNNITIADDIAFVVQFEAQYQQLFASTPVVPPQPAAAAPEVVKLFED
jgi:hypothetical protein